MFKCLQVGFELFSQSNVMSGALNLARKKRENLVNEMKAQRLSNANFEKLSKEWTDANGELQKELLNYIPNSVIRKSNNGTNIGVKNKSTLQAAITAVPNSPYKKYITPQIQRFLDVVDQYNRVVANARKAKAQESGEGLVLKNKSYTNTLRAILNAVSTLKNANEASVTKHAEVVQRAKEALNQNNMQKKFNTIKNVLTSIVAAKNAQINALKVLSEKKNTEHRQVLKNAATAANTKLEELRRSGNATAAELKAAANAAAAEHNAEKRALTNAAVSAAAQIVVKNAIATATRGEMAELKRRANAANADLKAAV